MPLAPVEVSMYLSTQAIWKTNQFEGDDEVRRLRRRRSITAYFVVAKLELVL